MPSGALRVSGRISPRTHPLTILVFALMAVRRRVIALVMISIDCLSACNCVVCVTTRCCFVSMMVVLNICRAACRRCAGCCQWAVMGAAAKNAVRKDGQASDDDDKLIHFYLEDKAPQLRLKLPSAS